MAEAEVIKAAYAAMAKKYHPDKGGTSQRMKEINEAYEVLSDAARKARYDAAYQQRQKKSEPQGAYRYQSSSYRQQGQSTSGTANSSYRSYERQRYTEQRQQASRSPPARDKLLPWPSWRWQRVALFSCFPMAIFLVFVMHSTVATALGWFLLATVSYACIKTRCLNKVKGASICARLAGRLAIVLGLGNLGLTAVFVGIPLAIIGLLVFSLLPIGKS